MILQESFNGPSPYSLLMGRNWRGSCNGDNKMLKPWVPNAKGQHGLKVWPGLIASEFASCSQSPGCFKLLMVLGMLPLTLSMPISYHGTSLPIPISIPVANLPICSCQGYLNSTVICHQWVGQDLAQVPLPCDVQIFESIVDVLWVSKAEASIYMALTALLLYLYQ